MAILLRYFFQINLSGKIFYRGPTSYMGINSRLVARHELRIPPIGRPGSGIDSNSLFEKKIQTFVWEKFFTPNVYFVFQLHRLLSAYLVFHHICITKTSIVQGSSPGQVLSCSMYYCSVLKITEFHIICGRYIRLYFFQYMI